MPTQLSTPITSIYQVYNERAVPCPTPVRPSGRFVSPLPPLSSNRVVVASLPYPCLLNQCLLSFLHPSRRCVEFAHRTCITMSPTRPPRRTFNRSLCSSFLCGLCRRCFADQAESDGLLPKRLHGRQTTTPQMPHRRHKRTEDVRHESKLCCLPSQPL